MKAFFVFLMILPVFVFSQIESKTDSLNMDDTFGISFSLKGLNLEKFEGGMGGKYWFSNDYATYLSFDFWLSEGENSVSNLEHNSGSITVGVEKHFFVKEIISPFIGIGLSYTSTTDEIKDKDFDDQSIKKRHVKYLRHSISTGVFARVEIFAVSYISFSANYGIWLRYSESDNRSYYNDGTSNNSKSDYTSINSSVSELTVSIYF